MAATDASGSLTYQAAYEAFARHGDTPSSEEWGSTPDRQQGNTKDEDGWGALNEGFRYRLLDEGVFMTPDPLGFVDGPNVYTYVVQNPWTKFDPLGLATKDELEGKQRREEHRLDRDLAKLHKQYESGDISEKKFNKESHKAREHRQKNIDRDQERINKIEASAKWVNEQMGFEVYNDENINDLDDGDGGWLGGTLESWIGYKKASPGVQEFKDIQIAMASRQALKEAVIGAAGGTTLKLGGKALGNLGSRIMPMVDRYGKPLAVSGTVLLSNPAVRSEVVDTAADVSRKAVRDIIKRKKYRDEMEELSKALNSDVINSK